MKIITANLPESFIKMMDKMIGERAIYPSRSELIRVAIREFLIKELESIDKNKQAPFFKPTFERFEAEKKETIIVKTPIQKSIADLKQNKSLVNIPKDIILKNDSLEKVSVNNANSTKIFHVIPKDLKELRDALKEKPKNIVNS